MTMLELVITLFLGLLLKVEVVSAEEEVHNNLLDAIIAVMTVFIFVYPVVAMILTSEKGHRTVQTVREGCASKTASWRKYLFKQGNKNSKYADPPAEAAVTVEVAL